MVFYYLPQHFHKKIDSVKERFYWQGTGKKKRYHFIKWSTLCRPKDFRGLGFMDTRTMNIYLLSKWIVKLVSNS